MLPQDLKDYVDKQLQNGRAIVLDNLPKDLYEAVNKYVDEVSRSSPRRSALIRGRS